jgi:predicted amidohydrolase
VKVGFVQTNPEFGQVEHNVSRAIDIIGSTNADLIVLPELFSTGYLFPDRRILSELAESVPAGPTCRRMSDLARSTKTTIVFGIAEKLGDKLYDSSVCAAPEGCCHIYRKLHLFAGEKSYFDPGDLPLQTYEVDDYRLGMMVCFDWIFPEVCRVLALKGAHVICHPVNLVLPYCQNVMRVRSIENQVFTITANRFGTESHGGKTVTFTGRSQITAPNGEVLAKVDESGESIQIVDADLHLAESKQVTEQNDVFADRRTRFYKDVLSS